MKNDMGHKDNGVNKFGLGRVGNLVFYGGAKWFLPQENTTASFLTFCTTMVYGQVFRIIPWRS